MAEQSPLTQGLIPPLLRAMAPNGARKPMTQMQGMQLLRTIAEWINRAVPGLRIVITDGVGSMTVYTEMTSNGAP